MQTEIFKVKNDFALGIIEKPYPLQKETSFRLEKVRKTKYGTETPSYFGPR